MPIDDVYVRCWVTGANVLRRAAVAGTWYPADPDALAREVDRYLDAASVALDGDLSAIIAPHAGLVYSGPIAAYSYAQLRARPIDVAVLVGPSHYVGFDGVAIVERGAFETPFGPIPIDEDCASALINASSVIASHPSAHIREHSLEMQLPFLKRVLPDIGIVPLVMGYQRRDTAFELGDVIARAVEGRRAMLIASTDLSHYQNARTAAALDGAFTQQVERFDPAGLMSLLEARPDHACGGGPTVSVMRAAQLRGATGARLLKYGDSGDVSGDKEAVVGYLAAAIGNFPAVAR